MTITAAALERFRTLLGPKGFTDDPQDIAPWLTDWRGRYHGAAPALLSPATTEEVAAAVRIAAEEQVPLVPQGGNSSMVGGATPPADGSALILSLRRMNAIRAINADAGMAICEAGVILSVLHDAAAAAGMRFPLSLGAKGSATVGGLISTNAGGTQVLRHGTMRALTLGIEAVMPDGSILRAMDALKKDNRGYDPRHLLCGAEGTLGIVTAATLRLVPAIVDRAVAWIGLSSPQQALDLLRFLEKGSGEAIEGFEILPETALRSVVAHMPSTRPPLAAPQPWHALIELDSDAPAGAQPQLEALLADAAERGMIADAVIAQNEAQADLFWLIRESISESERARGAALAHDISVPVADMPRFLDRLGAAVEARFPETSAFGYGHLGDGNIHFHVRQPADRDGKDWLAEAGADISLFVYQEVVAAGGSISAEHGIGQMKRDALVRLTDPARLRLLRSVKDGIDPLGIMNPGKLVPPPDAVPLAQSPKAT